ncbi:ash family protein [Citrobacter freundii]
MFLGRSKICDRDWRPERTKAHNTRASVFFCAVQLYLSMVGCMGAEQSAPVPLVPGYANPVQSTTSKIGVFGGGSKTEPKDANHGYYPYPNSTPVYLAFLFLPETPLSHRHCFN